MGFAAAIIANLDEGVIALDDAGRVTLINPAAERLIGWSEADLCGQPIHPLLDATLAAADDEPEAWRVLRMVLRRGSRQRVARVEFTCKDGALLPVALSCAPLQPAGHPLGVVIAFHDISERVAHTAALEYQIMHDPLTGLPNRVLLADRLQQALLAARRSGQPIGLLVFDLDGFKGVNDALGHAAGDAVLQQIGARVRDALRASDTVARLGGDEFVVVLPGAGVGGATRVAQQLRRALARPFPVEGRDTGVGASVGIAIAPEDGADMETLLRHADVAMYNAKRSRSGVALYRAPA
ncbi:MAG: diguanylate cyclase domain-containing protein [Dehalococcoidia bacterium]